MRTLVILFTTTLVLVTAGILPTVPWDTLALPDAAAGAEGPKTAVGNVRQSLQENKSDVGHGTANGKAWIVAQLRLPNGTPALVTFQVPDAPELTLKACEDLLPSVTPTLKSHIAGMPQLHEAVLAGAECIWSATDPIKPDVLFTVSEVPSLESHRLANRV